MKYILPALLLFITISSTAQRTQKTQKKDSLHSLICPFNDAYQPPQPKAAFNYDKTDPNIILASKTDSVVRAPIDATISKVQRDEEGKFEIVFFHNDYWFWYSGITKSAVRPNQKIKPGDPIGYNQPGEQVEILIYDFETPIDPKKYLDCK